MFCVGELHVVSPDGLKRTKEFHTKMDKMIESYLGDAIDEMVSVDTIATKLARQGHGLGSALLGTITNIVRSIQYVPLAEN